MSPRNTPFSRIAGLAVAAMLLVLAVGSTARAALIKLDLDRLVGKSRLVVCGEVTGLKSHWTDVPKIGRIIVTDVTVRVTEAWKGSPGKEVTVRLYGGRVGDDWVMCVESPRYSIGEKVLVFARDWRGRLWTTGWLQGKFTLVETRAGTQVVGSSELPIESVKPLGTVREDVRRCIARARAADRERGTRTLDPDRGGSSTEPGAKDSSGK